MVTANTPFSTGKSFPSLTVGRSGTSRFTNNTLLPVQSSAEPTR